MNALHYISEKKPQNICTIAKGNIIVLSCQQNPDFNQVVLLRKILSIHKDFINNSVLMQL